MRKIVKELITLVVVLQQYVEVHMSRTFHNHYFGRAHQFCTFFFPYIYCIDSVYKKNKNMKENFHYENVANLKKGRSK